MAYGTSHSSANSPISNFGYLLTCRLNSTSVYYEASTKTEIKHRSSTNTQRQSTEQKQYGKEKQYKKSTGTKPLNPEKSIS